jgi:hypothetical protein
MKNRHTAFTYTGQDKHRKVPTYVRAQRGIRTHGVRGAEDVLTVDCASSEVSIQPVQIHVIALKHAGNHMYHLL